MRLQDKVAIITGGANGIGFASAQRFLEEGAKVVIADFDQESGEASAKKLAHEGDLRFIHVDVVDETSVKKLVEETIATFGRIDILVNNAGILADATLLKMTGEMFDRVLDVNVKGVFNCTQAVAAHMIEQASGKIINTSSVSGVYGNFGQSNYAASKAAVVGLTQTWAKELGAHGINVNAVAPGFTSTEMIKTMPDKVVDTIKGQILLQKIAEPIDIANAYLFLASDEARYVHNHVLHVDGGIVM
ncbi:MAG TPA: 3-oxoacyl-ACP reductase family protein [Pseudogracilibacillus sp.]|nr:3-oxoacyl-ACP reductase family protein [Pseudogracilibacillus sp.]